MLLFGLLTWPCSSKVSDPVGYEPFTLQKYTKNERSNRQGNQDNNQVAIKMKRAWDVAMGPAKSIPMNAIMIYMSGTSLQIFTVMVTAMLFFNPVKAIMTTQQTFSRFESDTTPSTSTGKAQPKVDLTMPKLAFIGLHIVTILLGVYKVNAMGLLPNTASDWLAFIKPKEILEYAA
ncbi:hypothetical protein FB192DRAFT_1164223 [Mucor lusitanicus]|uniref:ER membrane protein complex subunit 4 n=1 Tax=Mucor circinelloides f. lusitanicus TaxID=29924 RepID=A0A8H4B9E0_MUCCL|nr:hypothetical protein FB192DRAFT_1164223 [Mucor lusitanicus]